MLFVAAAGALLLGVSNKRVAPMLLNLSAGGGLAVVSLRVADIWCIITVSLLGDFVFVTSSLRYANCVVQ